MISWRPTRPPGDSGPRKAPPAQGNSRLHWRLMPLAAAFGLASAPRPYFAASVIPSSLLMALLTSFPPEGSSIQHSFPVDSIPERVRMDTLSLSSGPYGEATALLEKTLLRIDVARLRLRFGAGTAAALEELLAVAPPSEATTQAAVELAVRAKDAWAGLTFLRDTSFRRFLDGVLDGVEAAYAGGLIGDSFAEELSDSLPVWYEPLRGRGVQDGDVMMYRIRGDTLRTLFIAVEGTVLVDHTDVGPEPRLAVLGGFLEPDSDFRKGLLRSLLGYRDRSR